MRVIIVSGAIGFPQRSHMSTAPSFNMCRPVASRSESTRGATAIAPRLISGQASRHWWQFTHTAASNVMEMLSPSYSLCRASVGQVVAHWAHNVQAVASSTTEKGRGIDKHQVHSERVAYAATQVEACRAILKFAKDADAAGSDESALYLEQAAVYVGEVASRLGAEMRAAANDYGLADNSLASQSVLFWG